MINTLTGQEAIEREEISESLAATYMSGFTPSNVELQRAVALGINPQAIREAVDACYDPEED